MKRDNHFIWSYFKQKFKSIDSARILQAKEYKRRLKDLNGEAHRLRSMQAEYVPREVFDRTVNELREKIDILTVFKTKQEGKSTGYAQFIGWIAFGITFVAFLIMLYNSIKN